MQKEKIIIAGDHKTYDLKKELCNYITELGFEPEDLGAYSSERVDYPLYAFAIGDKMARGWYRRGIVLCSSGIGVSMVANKFPRVRAALVHDEHTAEMTRKHNDSNVLALAAGSLTTEKAKSILKTWLSTDFEGGRHQKRLDQITDIEKNLMRDVYGIENGEVQISASLMCADQLNLLEETNKLVNAGVDLIHIDIIDGHFASNISLNIDHVFALRSHTNVPIDIHLMVTNPKDYIERLATAGADIVTIHIESEGNILEILKDIKSRGMKTGLAINIDTPIEELYPYLEYTDLVMFMCIKTGFKATPFKPEVLKKIRAFNHYIKDKNYKITLAADGSIGPRTVPELYNEGIRIFIGGTSGLFRQGSFEENIKNLRSYCH